MKKRNTLLVGFSLGYFWHWTKPARKTFKKAVVEGFIKANDRWNKEHERDASTGEKRIKVTVDTRASGEFLLAELIKLIREYGFVTRRDLRDLVGLPVPIKGEDLGWTSLAGVTVEPVDINSPNTQWVILFPQPEEV